MNTNLAREVWANRKWHHIWRPVLRFEVNAMKVWACRRCDQNTVNRTHQALTICHASPKMLQNYAAHKITGE